MADMDGVCDSLAEAARRFGLLPSLLQRGRCILLMAAGGDDGAFGLAISPVADWANHCVAGHRISLDHFALGWPD